MGYARADRAQQVRIMDCRGKGHVWNVTNSICWNASHSGLPGGFGYKRAASTTSRPQTSSRPTFVPDILRDIFEHGTAIVNIVGRAPVGARVSVLVKHCAAHRDCETSGSHCV